MSPAVKKWTIFRRGEALGTFTAAEVREQLRKGVLSTNDFAASDGSPIQQEIIEIDAIFGNPDGRDELLTDAPRRSRWARKAEEIKLRSAPVTRPRPGRLDRVHHGNAHGHAHAHGHGNRHRQGQSPPGGGLRQTPGTDRRTAPMDPWLMAGVILIAAMAAGVLAWLFTRRG